MSVLASLKLVEFKPIALSSAHNRRSKLIEKIEQQIRLANDPTYAPTKTQRTKGDDGVERLVEVPKRIKRWWHEDEDGTVMLTIRYGGRPLELATGVSTIVCAGVADVVDALAGIKSAVTKGGFDTLLEAHVGVGKVRRPANVVKLLRD